MCVCVCVCVCVHLILSELCCIGRCSASMQIMVVLISGSAMAKCTAHLRSLLQGFRAKHFDEEPDQSQDKSLGMSTGIRTFGLRITYRSSDPNFSIRTFAKNQYVQYLGKMPLIYNKNTHYLLSRMKQSIQYEFLNKKC